MQCAEQLQRLKERLGESYQPRAGWRQRATALRMALDELRGATAVEMPERRFWLQTLQLVIVRNDEVQRIDPTERDPQHASIGQDQGRARRLNPDSIFAAVQGVPVERGEILVTGRFSPAAVALRVLSVFYKLDFDFLGATFEDHDLFVRKLVYPLDPKWRSSMRALGKKRLKKTGRQRRG